MHFNQFFNMCEKYISDTLCKTDGMLWTNKFKNQLKANRRNIKLCLAFFFSNEPYNVKNFKQNSFSNYNLGHLHPYFIIKK